MSVADIQKHYDISRAFFAPANTARITDELSLAEAIDALADLFRDVRSWIQEDAEEIDALKRRLAYVDLEHLYTLARMNSRDIAEMRETIGALRALMETKEHD